ncbi:MAG: hypothetical protein ACOX2G_03455 [Bacillota bacterium]
MNKKPSKALTFFLSFCPGVGHLYLGAMTRGLQFLILFFGNLALIDLIRLPLIPYGLPIIWFYGLFDALQLADQQPLVDKPLVEWGQMRGPWTGLILIGLGLLLIVDEIVPSLWNRFLREILGYYDIRTLLMAVFLIIAGFLLLRGKRVKRDG